MQKSKRNFNFLHKTNFNAELQESNSMNLANIICLHINSIQYSIYIYIYKSKGLMWKYEVLPSDILYDIFLIQASISSKFSIFVKLVSNGKCIYFNVLIKFKEFVYIYNFTCFELIQIDLKSHGKCRNQKNFFNFLHMTNFNAELQESNSMNLANIICLHINSIQYIYIYIYLSKCLMWKYEVGYIYI